MRTLFLDSGSGIRRSGVRSSWSLRIFSQTLNLILFDQNFILLHDKINQSEKSEKSEKSPKHPKYTYI